MTGNGAFIPTIYGDDWGMVFLFLLYPHDTLLVSEGGIGLSYMDFTWDEVILDVFYMYFTWDGVTLHGFYMFQINS